MPICKRYFRFLIILLLYLLNYKKWLTYIAKFLKKNFINKIDLFIKIDKNIFFLQKMLILNH